MIIKLDKKNIENYRLINFNLDSSINEHTILDLDLEVLNEISVQFKEISIEVNDSLIFFGKVYESFSKNFALNGKLLKIKAYSFSKLLENDFENVIYQDEEISYYEIIDNILKKYKFNYLISDKLKKKTGRLYIKYLENDFDFIKRILNDINEVVYTSYNGLFLIGFSDLSKINIKNIVVSGIKNNNSYFELKDEVYLAGDMYEDKYTLKAISKLENGIFKTSLELINKKDFKVFFKTNIQGAFLEAKVIELNPKDNKAMMKVDFSNSIKDESKNKKNLSFATPYSKTHTGFFLSPEIGDIVDVYFPSNNENDAKVAFCINNEESIRFCDYNKRNFITNKIQIEAIDGRLSFNAENITVEATSNINYKSNEDMYMNSKKSCYMESDEIVVVSKKKDIEINSKNNILLKAKKVFNN